MSSTGTRATSETAAAAEAAKAQAPTGSTPQVDFNTSCFSAAPAPGLQAPQFTARAMQPTPVAQQAGLQAPNFTADLFDPNPMGPLGAFQGPAVAQVPVGLETGTFAAVVTAPIPQPRPANLGNNDGINFGPDAVPGAVSAHSRQVLSEIMATAGVSDVRVTSTARTPEAQARAMYDNLQSQGVQAQRDLYGRYGDQVIDAYEASVQAGLSRDATLQAMVDRINEVGPSNVSRHLADPAVRNIIDISPRSIPEELREAFQEAVRNHPDVERFLGPADGDPAYHVEIRQPGAE
ncbi:hypothetical protein ACLESD_02040 [Pyxidicoccus sp. 3LFB2]